MIRINQAIFGRSSLPKIACYYAIMICVWDLRFKVLKLH